MKKIKKIKLFGITIIRIETFQRDKKAKVKTKQDKLLEEQGRLIAELQKLLNK